MHGRAFEGFDDVEVEAWRRSASETDAIIIAALRSRDWDAIDSLAERLGIANSPQAIGAWAAICEALCGRRSKFFDD